MTPCRKWSGFFDSEGYGYVHDHRLGKRLRAHRYLYEQAYGPIPDGYIVHHECENRACVELGHLRAMTRAEHNLLHRRAATHCKRGHEFNEANTRWETGNSGSLVRRCRRCDADAQRRYQLRKRAA